MDDKLDTLLEQLKRLEDEMRDEIHKKEKQFGYTVHKGKVRFQESIARQHRLLAKKLIHYWREAKFSSFVTTPVILSCIVPILLMDGWASVYQFICFPAYGIPKVRRSDYVVMDRHHLRYLNTIERLNCVYCGYVNGVLAYVQEIAGRTEQHWCPIKHAIRLKTMHSRYTHFLDYGDAGQFRKRIEDVRRDFEDLKKKR
jgi:hypothetical protein